MHPIVTLCLVAFSCAACLKGLDFHTRGSSSPRPPKISTAGANDILKMPASPPRPRAIQCDLYCCNCNGPKARCTGQDGRKWHYLPQLPATIRDFRMMRSDFYNLTRTMLANLSNFDIMVMNLTFNKIHYIEPQAFADFVKMESLDLSGNPIPMPELRAALRGIPSTSMKTVALGKMELSFLPDDFFDMFSNMTFRIVDLKQNHFRSFNTAIFAAFWRVDIVKMFQNEISEVNMTARVNIGKLILKENKFQQFPDLCLHRSPTTGEAGYFRAFYYLQSLYIANNPFRQIQSSVLRGACLPYLRKLDISWSTMLKTLENNFVADLPRLEHLMVNHMTNLDRYERYAFNSSSLKILTLNENHRLDREVVDIQHMFRYCPNLERLSIVSTKLKMDEGELKTLLVQLQAVKYLNIQRIRRGNIPEDLLWRLPRLQKLQFTGNNMNSDGLARALVNVTHLPWLNVQANSITVVNETTLPWEFRRQVTWLELSQNPFTCTCELLWFRRWLDDVHRNKSVKIKNFPSGQYRCYTPEAMKRVHLADFHPTEEMCAVRNPYLLIGVVGGCLLAGLALVSVFVYRYRWHLRFYLYRLRRRHKYTQIPGGLVNEDGTGTTLFTYDAYLAHSGNDLDWTMKELLPYLEGERGLKVFLEERDSVPGTVVADNISRYMDESSRVLLLISDNYNREGWRQYEFEHILFAAIEQQKDIIVLLLGDVEAGWMTKNMRRMLTRGTFLQWGESEEAKRKFRDGLKVALQTQDVSCHNVC